MLFVERKVENMATYTSFLNLEKPTTSERLDVLKINSNWDKIDAGVSSLNSQLLNDDLTNTVTIGQNATIERLVIHRIGKLVFFSFRATNTTNLDILIDNLPAAKKTTGICPYSGSQLAYIAEGSRSIQAQGVLTNQNITGFYISV